MVLQLEQHGRVRVIRIHRPDALNAMNDGVYSALRDALADTEADDSVAVAVLTGTGADAFTELIGAPPNREAVAAFMDKRDPDFSSIPGA